MKKTTLALAALLSAAIIVPAAYAEDTAPASTTPAPAAQNCKEGDTNCQKDAATSTAPTDDASAQQQPASADTGS